MALGRATSSVLHPRFRRHRFKEPIVHRIHRLEPPLVQGYKCPLALGRVLRPPKLHWMQCRSTGQPAQCSLGRCCPSIGLCRSQNGLQNVRSNQKFILKLEVPSLFLEAILRPMEPTEWIIGEVQPGRWFWAFPI